MTAVRARTAVCDGGNCTARLPIERVDDGGAKRVLEEAGWYLIGQGWEPLVFCPEHGPVQAVTPP